MSRRVRLGVASVVLGVLLAACTQPVTQTLDEVLNERYSGVIQIVGRTNGSALTPRETLLVEFLVPVVPESIELGGDLGAVAAVDEVTGPPEGAMSARVTPPDSGWPSGSGRSLTVSARVDQRAVEPVTLSFDVLDSALHVSPSRGSYSGSGSADRPLNSIHTALARAEELFGGDSPVEVRLAEGVHLIATTEETVDGIVVPSWITVAGGYRDDFAVRDPSVHETVIRSLGEPGPFSGQYVAIRLESALLEGVTVQTPPGADVLPVRMLGSSTVRDLVIEHDDGPALEARQGGVSLVEASTLDSRTNEGVVEVREAGLFIVDTTVRARAEGGDAVGVSVIEGAMELQRTRVDVGVASGFGVYGWSSEVNLFDTTVTLAGAQLTYGVYTRSCELLFVRSVIRHGPGTFNTGMDLLATDALVVNSLVDAGHAENQSLGIVAEGGSLVVRTSTIGVSNSGFGSAIQVTAVDSVPVPTTVQNTILAATGGSGSGYLIDTDSAATTTLQNSNLFGPTTTSYLATRAFESDTRILVDSGDIGLVETEIAGAGGTADTNYDLDPVLANPTRLVDGGDWRLTAGSPASIRTGGLDGLTLGWNVAYDADTVERTVPWSIGAYEYD